MRTAVRCHFQKNNNIVEMQHASSLPQHLNSSVILIWRVFFCYSITLNKFLTSFLKQINMLAVFLYVTSFLKEINKGDINVNYETGRNDNAFDSEP